jgi:uncharacterized protein (TIGR02594 family)
MHFTSKIAVIAGCICLLGLSVPAIGLPKQKSAEKLAQISRQAKAQQANGNKAKVLKVLAKARDARQERAMRLVSTPISELPKRPLLGWPALVSEARKYMGTNPTARSRLWCATFMNMVLAKVGYSGTNSDAAKSFAQYGRRINEPQIGAIAVLTRGKNGGHVGVVSGIDNQGNPIVISGNHGKRVGEAVYPRSRVIAYVMPSGDRSEPTTQLAARSTPSASNERRAPSDGSIDSPITELLAAIEAEQNRSEGPARVPAQAPSAQARGPEPRRQEARREVRQEVRQQSSQPVIARAGTLPLDPRLSELLGLSEKTRARAQPPAPVVAAPKLALPPTTVTPPLRQRQVQQI